MGSEVALDAAERMAAGENLRDDEEREIKWNYLGFSVSCGLL